LSKTNNIVLVGNPNCGKTSLFNELTGLNQKVGNFAGVTVEKKIGYCQIANNKYTIIDLPGTYSLYPKSGDEYVAYDALFDKNSDTLPDAIVVLVDASNLKRNLLFCTQIIDLGYPVVVALTMVDIAANKGTVIDTEQLSIQLGVPVVPINPRKGKGIAGLKKQMAFVVAHAANYKYREVINNTALIQEQFALIKQLFPTLTPYACLHIATEIQQTSFLNNTDKAAIQHIINKYPINKTKIQAQEVMQRYAQINKMMRVSVREDDPLKKELRTERIDKILLHKVWGNVILLVVLFLLFQSIFQLAAYPMDWIDGAFSQFTQWLSGIMPNNLFSQFVINGLVAGIGGILVFVPQIMILFGLITLLEDTGYMARISFLTDRLMRSVGLNGKAVLPIISGMACAVPAIMSARTIENKKQRLITILVTPLTSCSARLPVYTLLLSLVIPNTTYLGVFSLKGLVMMGLYLFSFAMALIVAKFLDLVLKATNKSIFLLELPVYRAPRWQNIMLTMMQKAKVFVMDAGKIILIISVIVWALCSFGPSKSRLAIEAKYKQVSPAYTAKDWEAEKNQALLANSYAGIFGKTIEPAIKPLGFDWKIGIALITSFAAREVFVGTMATIYSAGDANDNTLPLMQKMANAKTEENKPVYTLATGVSLMLFYVFALQCMSTLGIVKKETNSWKWPIIQFLYMGVLAYLFSFVAYQLLK
jgi:ferrous iron transport protein B